MEQINRSKHWLAVYTKPRSEKAVEKRLSSLGVECYCPVQKVLKQWSDRKKMVAQPLFTSYVFVRVSETERVFVLSDPGVKQFVWWLGRPAVIPDQEIESIKQFLLEHTQYSFELSSIGPGDAVKVNSGPLKDYQGVVLDANKVSARLRLESIGYQLIAKVSKVKLSVDN